VVLLLAHGLESLRNLHLVILAIESCQLEVPLELLKHRGEYLLVELLRLFLLRVEYIEEQELVRGRHGILEFLRREV
jgi:hypothetical protein